jgi:hypothetical protein
MMVTRDCTPPLAEQELIAVQGGLAYVTAIERRLAS